MNWFEGDIYNGATNANGSAWEGGESAYRKDLPAGSVHWTRAKESRKPIHLVFICPCGCGAVNPIPVTTEPGGYGWIWDGNETDPTLTPSILRTTGCKWHGHLTKGEWKKA